MHSLLSALPNLRRLIFRLSLCRYSVAWGFAIAFALVMSAQMMRAVLLASATAATFVERR